MTTEEKIEVIRAFDEGEDVEVYDEQYKKWYKKSTSSNIGSNFWDFDIYKYRVKPKHTRLEVANEFFEKTFGVKNAFVEDSCLVHCLIPCSECVAHKNGECQSEEWWNAPCEEPKGE